MQQNDHEAAKMSLDKLVVQVSEATEELQAAVARLSSELEKVNGESDTCRAQKVLSHFLGDFTIF